MVDDLSLQNSVRSRRQALGWSQIELSRRAGVSRSAVSAIEMQRLTPSAAAALALARAMNCRVEDIFFFGGPTDPSDAGPEWAWAPKVEPSRFWRAVVDGKSLLYPVEPVLGAVPHDGVQRAGDPSPSDRDKAQDAANTLILATCDPAAGLLGASLRQAADVRMIAFCRSSSEALRLLRDGLVHVAGLHFSHEEDAAANREAILRTLSGPHCLLRVARWQEGIVCEPSLKVRSTRGALSLRRRWVGREPGSSARQCMDTLRGDHPAPRRQARDHRGVAEAIRNGWADLGVCLRLTGEEAGLKFLPVREEGYDLCFRADLQNDPRVAALIRTVRSASYRRLLGELPGYDARETGMLEEVK